MKIISVEGLDKAGKATAMEALRIYFEAYGLNVKTMSFPRYETQIGALIKDWLTGKSNLNTTAFELLQAADKQSARDIFDIHERNGVDVVLCDRYIHSQLAYGAYDNDPLWVENLLDGVREPDAVIYLDVEPEVSMSRAGKHNNGINDKYEADVERLRSARKTYLRYLNDAVNYINDVASQSVFFIDANTPLLITRAKVLRAGCLLAENMFGLDTSEQDDKQLI